MEIEELNNEQYLYMQWAAAPKDKRWDQWFAYCDARDRLKPGMSRYLQKNRMLAGKRNSWRYLDPSTNYNRVVQ